MNLSRREWVAGAAALLAGACASHGINRASREATRPRFVETVTGPIPADELGVTPHHRLTFTGLQFELEI